MRLSRIQKHLSTFQVIIFGFAALILVGALLLMTPPASREGTWTSFSDALFTSTSATCVAGLVVRDTATYWSLFGQIVILVLIQIGGLGIVVAASAIAILSGHKISLMQRSTIQDSISAPHLGGIVRLTRFIVRRVFAIEGIGALVLATRFIPRYGAAQGIWYSIFHSISATCNAGFDLMGNYSSMTSWSSDPVVLITLALLLLIGGIGFVTWSDFHEHHFHLQRYSLQSKMVLSLSAVLIVVPTLCYYFFEFPSLHGADKWLTAFFQAVTPRTAGFNSVDLNMLSDAGLLLMIVLMLTGGATGSTAGGMKINTLSVLVVTAVSIFRKQDKPTVHGRSLGHEAVSNAQTIALLYLVLFLLSGAIISRVEDLPLLTCLFETASAIGTVGLTLGITTSLSLFSRIVLMLLMFIGRIGGMTMIYAIFNDPHVRHSHYVTEKISVG